MSVGPTLRDQWVDADPLSTIVFAFYFLDPHVAHALQTVTVIQYISANLSKESFWSFHAFLAFLTLSQVSSSLVSLVSPFFFFFSPLLNYCL